MKEHVGENQHVFLCCKNYEKRIKNMLTQGIDRWYTHRALSKRAVRKFFEN